MTVITPQLKQQWKAIAPYLTSRDVAYLVEKRYFRNAVWFYTPGNTPTYVFIQLV